MTPADQDNSVPAEGSSGYLPVPPPPPQATRLQRAALIIGLLIGFWLTLQLFGSVLAPFVAAGVLAYALDPAIRSLHRLGLSRGLAAGLMIIAVLLGVLLFALLLYPLVIVQVSLLVTRIPHYATLVQDWSKHMLSHLQEQFGPEVVNDKIRDLVAGQAGSMLSILLSTFTGLIGSGFAIFNLLSLAVVTPVAGFYLLRDWPRIVRMIDSWLPYRYRDVIRAQAREVDRVLSAWVRGQALCCLFLALYYATTLTVAGLDLGLIVGLMAGVLSFIPYVGTITGGVTAIGLAMATYTHWSGVLMIVGILIVGQTLEGYVIYPRFLGDRVELPAVWVIFALFAGGAAFGFVGVMLAVPVAATIGVLARFWLRRYLASPLYLDPPAT
ncbi:MAG: AI-2E family transporter [Acetobacteraceae bacterium]